MADPVSTTSATTASVGLMALLIGALGPVAADVMLVVISAIAGCFIAMSAMTHQTNKQATMFLLVSVTASLVLAWSLSSAVSGISPYLQGPYTPSTIAFVIGFLSNRLPAILNALVKKAEDKAGIQE